MAPGLTAAQSTAETSDVGDVRNRGFALSESVLLLGAVQCRHLIGKRVVLTPQYGIRSESPILKTRGF